MIGAGAGYIENIGACTFLGFVAGFITAIVMNTVVPRMNSSNIVDSQGFIIPILIVTFLGGFFAFPCILLRHFSLGNDEGTTYGALGGVK